MLARPSRVVPRTGATSTVTKAHTGRVKRRRVRAGRAPQAQNPAAGAPTAGAAAPRLIQYGSIRQVIAQGAVRLVPVLEGSSLA